MKKVPADPFMSDQPKLVIVDDQKIEIAHPVVEPQVMIHISHLSLMVLVAPKTVNDHIQAPKVMTTRTEMTETIMDTEDVTTLKTTDGAAIAPTITEASHLTVAINQIVSPHHRASTRTIRVTTLPSQSKNHHQIPKIADQHHHIGIVNRTIDHAVHTLAEMIAFHLATTPNSKVPYEAVTTVLLIVILITKRIQITTIITIQNPVTPQLCEEQPLVIQMPILPHFTLLLLLRC
jgi:hypothetical protein